MEDFRGSGRFALGLKDIDGNGGCGVLVCAVRVCGGVYESVLFGERGVL